MSHVHVHAPPELTEHHGGEGASAPPRASSSRTQALEASTRAGQSEIRDLLNFNEWLA